MLAWSRWCCSPRLCCAATVAAVFWIDRNEKIGTVKKAGVSPQLHHEAEGKAGPTVRITFHPAGIFWLTSVNAGLSRQSIFIHVSLLPKIWAPGSCLMVSWIALAAHDLQEGE